MRAILLASLLSSAAVNVRGHPTHEKRGGLNRRTVDLNAFRIVSTAEYINATETASNTTISSSPLLRRDTYVETATELVKATFPGKTFRVVGDHYVGANGIGHVNFKQTVHDLDIDNADFNVNVDTDGKIFSFGNSFFIGDVPEVSPLTKRDHIDPVAALKGATGVLQLPVEAAGASSEPADGQETYTLTGTTGAVKDPVARLVYFQKADGSLALTWRVETDILSNWLLTYVDATSGEEVHGVVDYSADASYQVYPWGINDPTEGSRVTISNPWDTTASEFTWQGTGSTTYTSTRGNNGIAQVNPSGGDSYLNNYRPTNSAQNFVYPYSPSTTTPTSYRDASITQLFYTANMYHDLLYELGFTEVAGNFEVNNDGQGGVGGDFVILNAQDGSGTNNANFATPPDGESGRMRMFLWTYTTPQRDCSFEAGVVIHEFTHGVSTRLTGGPANSNCLNSLEAGGMGEGWGDFMATAIRLKAADTRATNYPIGAWVYGDPAGIRTYLYSTSLTTNPLTYTSLNTRNEVHAIGEVWANVLYEMLWNLIDKHGKSTANRPTFDSKGVPTDGKFLAMKLVIDAMALQPCNPNMVQARDAILDADVALTGGANKCAIWTAFAKRGLGSGAVYSSTKRTGSTTIKAGAC